MITLAQAPSDGGSVFGSLLFPVVLLVGMYLLLIRPQRARAKQLAAVRGRIAPGVRVITTAGLHARVVEVADDTVVLEIAPGVQAVFASQAVVQLLDEPAAESVDEEPDRLMALDLQALLASRTTDVPDFPTPGIVFKDISPVLADPTAFAAAVDAVVDHWTAAGPGAGIDTVVGIEARGFLLAAPVAYRLGAGFVPVRKPGKLPGELHEVAYDLEYGSNVLQVQRTAFSPGARVLVVDDVLATGGTAAAAVRLVREAGAVPVGFAVLLELAFLDGRAALADAHAGLDVQALLTV